MAFNQQYLPNPQHPNKPQTRNLLDKRSAGRWLKTEDSAQKREDLLAKLLD
jgi:hypothetical protein